MHGRDYNYILIRKTGRNRALETWENKIAMLVRNVGCDDVPCAA
jgi:hypothetical protein